MFLLLWLLFGGLIGWVASVLTHNDRRMGLLANIFIGLSGSAIGMIFTELTGLGNINSSIWQWEGMLFSILGAVFLLTIINIINKRSRLF